MPIPNSNSSSHIGSSSFSSSSSSSFSRNYQETNHNYAVALSFPTSPASSSHYRHSHCSSSSSSRYQRPRTLPSHRQPELQSLEQPPPTKKMSLYPMRLYSSERPPSPLALTSSIAPPSLMPATATASSLRSKRSANLKLSMLPTSSPSSSASSSSSSSSMSYYSHHNHKYNYANSLSTQQKLQLHQREIITSATRANGIPAHLLSSGPLSPRLIPLGSPGGPVTPLDLEQEKDGSYFAGHELGDRLQYVTAPQSQCS